MKASFRVFISIFLFLAAGIAVAQEVVQEPTMQEWIQFLISLKGANALGALGIAGVAVQGLLYIFRSRFVTLTGKQKLMVVQFLSIIAGVIGLRSQNLDWASALIHANTLGAFQVFLHQVYKQFTDAGDKYILPVS